MRFVLIGLIKFYRLTFSRVTGGGCIYTPTCSVYGLEAAREFGFLRACLLITRRILRCAPWGRGGFDPVPYNLKGEMKWLF